MKLELLGRDLKLEFVIMYWVTSWMNFLLAWRRNLIASTPYRVISYSLSCFSFIVFHRIMCGMCRMFSFFS